MTAQEDIFGPGGGASNTTMPRVLDELAGRLRADGLSGRCLSRRGLLFYRVLELAGQPPTGPLPGPHRHQAAIGNTANAPTDPWTSAEPGESPSEPAVEDHLTCTPPVTWIAPTTVMPPGRAAPLADRVAAPPRARRAAGQDLHQDIAVPSAVGPSPPGHPRPTKNLAGSSRLGLGHRSRRRLESAPAPAHRLTHPSPSPPPTTPGRNVEPAPT